MDCYKCQVEGENHFPGSSGTAPYIIAHSASVIFAAKALWGLIVTWKLLPTLYLFCNQDKSVKRKIQKLTIFVFTLNK